MSDLFTKPSESKLKLRYKGEKITPCLCLYNPIRLLYYEIIDSSLNKGKELVVGQIILYDKKEEVLSERLLMTESFGVLKTLHSAESENKPLPYDFKFIRNRKGFIMLEKLNKKEKSLLNRYYNNDIPEF